MKKIIKLLEHTFYLTKPGFTIVDLGSNIGKFHDTCINTLGRANIDRYIGVEPHPTLYEQHLKGREDHVTAFYNKAVAGTRNKYVDFYPIEGNHECGNIIGKDEFLWQERPRPIKVITTDLGELFSDNRLNIIDYMKMDIEGGEYDVIDSMTYYEASLISQMSIEFHDFVDPKLLNKTHAAIRKLAELGFKMVYSAGLDYMHTTKYADCLFIDKKLL